MFGIAALVAGVWFAFNLGETKIIWEPYSDAALVKAKEQGTPVLIDFFAD
jgi:hypothetical protein